MWQLLWDSSVVVFVFLIQFWATALQIQKQSFFILVFNQNYLLCLIVVQGQNYGVPSENRSYNGEY